MSLRAWARLIGGCVIVFSLLSLVASAQDEGFVKPKKKGGMAAEQATGGKDFVKPKSAEETSSAPPAAAAGSGADVLEKLSYSRSKDGVRILIEGSGLDKAYGERLQNPNRYLLPYYLSCKIFNILFYFNFLNSGYQIFGWGTKREN